MPGSVSPGLPSRPGTVASQAQSGPLTPRLLGAGHDAVPSPSRLQPCHLLVDLEHRKPLDAAGIGPNVALAHHCLPRLPRSGTNAALDGTHGGLTRC